jgi:hypothetical protein
MLVCPSRVASSAVRMKRFSSPIFITLLLYYFSTFSCTTHFDCKNSPHES